MAYPRGGMAVKDLTFRIAKGEFAFLTGHSGAGKSTILKLISAATRPTQGEVKVSGFDVGALSAREIPKPAAGSASSSRTSASSRTARRRRTWRSRSR